jgi:23S rRNA (cytosine1962-C5)-methyltransferase
MEWISLVQWTAFAAEDTDAHRLATGKDGWLDRYGDWILWSGSKPPRVETLRDELSALYGFAPRGYLARELVRKASDQKPAMVIAGEEPSEITVQENGLCYLVEPAGGYSSGLFLDQRLNRHWVSGLGARRMLNLFAYTCSFTVCAASAGAETCSVDASKRVLGMGRRNLELNGIDPAEGHRFLADDVLKVVPRLLKRGETFDLIVLDPPTFGRADGRVFRIEKDLVVLVRDCFELLETGGSLLVSCNNAEWGANELRKECELALGGIKAEFQPGELPPEIAWGAVSWRIRAGGSGHRRAINLGSDSRRIPLSHDKCEKEC